MALTLANTTFCWKLSVEIQHLQNWGYFLRCGMNIVHINHLRNGYDYFQRRVKNVICGPGENAGIVDIGDNQAVVFKMESHNHPSYIEPHQGAATGVGGILRDVFTMGARPIAAMNALSFGEINHPRTKELVHGVVEGIGSYGNSFGVPTVGGEIRFNKSYNGNCLVNAFAAGLVDHNMIFYSAASGVGMPVVYLGAKTGRDGVGGATMASAEFDDTIEEKRPTFKWAILLQRKDFWKLVWN